MNHQSIQTLEPRPFCTRATENCDALLNMHLPESKTGSGAILKRCGLTLDSVRRMTDIMKPHKGQVLRWEDYA